MKAPLVVLIVIVVAILGFLLVYSQQHEMPAQTTQGQGAAGGYGAPSGGYGAPAGGYGAPPAAGGYGAPSGGYGK